MIKKWVFLLIVVLFSFPLFSKNNYSLVRSTSAELSNFSGDLQHGNINDTLAKKLHFTVVKDNAVFVPDFPIRLKIISFPEDAEDFSYDTLIYTNAKGIAETFFVVGSKRGEYELLAYIDSESPQRVLVYKFYGRNRGWVFFLVIGLLGGLALFLYGMHLMSDGLQKSAGNRMKTILSSITHNNLIGVIVGAVVTMIIQSSSATSVMLVSFVNSRLMRFRQTLGILLGAAIGTTITAQLIAFKLTDYSLLMIGIGGGLFLFTSKNNIKSIGEAILGFGILFFGMDIMSGAMKPMRSYEPFIDLLLQLENPFLGILVGAVFTALVQSSSAFIGIMIILASQGLLTLESSIALLLGANLGTPITAILASIKTSAEAKKVAVALLVYKVVLVLLFVGLIGHLVTMLQNISSYFYTDLYDSEIVSISKVLPRQIANAHTIFNVVLAIIALPFMGAFERFISFLFRKQKNPVQSNVLYLTDSFRYSPVVALSLVKRETLNMGKRVNLDLDKIIVPFLDNNASILQSIQKDREDVKEIRDVIKEYLIKNTQKSIDSLSTSEAYLILHTVDELSHINDVITKTLHRRAEKWIEREYSFSEIGRKEILDLYTVTKRGFSNSLKVFDQMDEAVYLLVEEDSVKVDEMSNKYILNHYNRIVEGEEEFVESSKTYLELINMLQAINKYSLSIAKYTLAKKV